MKRITIETNNVEDQKKAIEDLSQNPSAFWEDIKSKDIEIVFIEAKEENSVDPRILEEEKLQEKRVILDIVFIVSITTYVLLAVVGFILKKEPSALFGFMTFSAVAVLMPVALRFISSKKK